MMEFLKWWGSLSTDFALGVGFLVFVGFLGIIHLIEFILKLSFEKKV